MRILIATGIYPPDIGGPATYVKELCEELPKRGFDITVLTYADKEGCERENDVRIVKVGRNHNTLVRYFLYFRQILLHKNIFDCIYVQDPVSAGVPVWFASKILNKPYILKVVGDYAWEQGTQRFGVEGTVDEFQTKKYSFFVELMRFLQKCVAKSAKKIIVPSKYLQKIVTDWIPNSSKIQVIYNALNPIYLEKTKEKIREEKGLSGFVLLSIGRLVPWKGFSTLIDVTKELSLSGKEVTLYVGGEGPDREELQNRVNSLGLQKSVRFLGKLSHNDVLEYLKGSDVFVLNTQYEGLSHVLLEATLLRTPIITTDVGGNPEIVKNGVNGVLVSYNDKRMLLEKIEEFSKKSFDCDEKKVQELLENFDKQKTLDQLTDELQNV